MKDSIRLPLEIPVSPEIKALFDRGLYEFDDYFHTALVEALEDVLIQKTPAIVRQTYDDVREAMTEMMGD